MTESNPPPGEEPKKSLKLLLRSKPVAEVETSVGRIYLYPLRLRDLTDFGNLEPADAVNQVRDFLTRVASLTVESDEAPERIPLDADTAKELSDDEIEQIAEAYVQSSKWQKAQEGAKGRKSVVQQEGETVSAYLIRLVQGEVEHQRQLAKQIAEKILGPSHSIFEQVRKSTSALSSTLSAYDQFRKMLEPSQVELQPVRSDHVGMFSKHMDELAEARAKERAEEMELARLTGKMTAQSAETLKDLAVAATTLMEQFDQRDRKTDKDTRTQINIAVWSVGVSALLALIALIVSTFAFLQDRDNASSGERIQQKLLSAIEIANQQRSFLERENDALREQVEALDTRTEDIDAAKHATVEPDAISLEPD